MDRILVLGAGGHGQVVADAIMSRYQPDLSRLNLAFLDDDKNIVGETRLGLPILGTLDELPLIPHYGIVIGIGNNFVRSQIFQQLTRLGETVITVQHSSAIIGSNVKIGQGTVICAGAIVNTGTVIGNNVILNTGCTVDHHSNIGDHAHIAPGVHLGGNVEVGEGTLVGIGSTVMPQQGIGKWSIIGAGALVTISVVDYTVAIGTPARPLRSIQRNTNNIKSIES